MSLEKLFAHFPHEVRCEKRGNFLIRRKKVVIPRIPDWGGDSGSWGAAIDDMRLANFLECIQCGVSKEFT